MQPVFGVNPRGYHAVSIGLHAVNSLLLLALAFRITGDRRGAVVAAVLFAVLPSHLEAIGWIAAIGDLMAAGLVMVTVLTALAAADTRPPGRIAWTALSLLVAVAACAAKESALVVAILAPAAAWFFAPKRPGWQWMALHPAVTLGWLAWRTTRAGAPLSFDVVSMIGPYVPLYMGAKKMFLTVLPVLRTVSDRVLTPTSSWTWVLMAAVWAGVAVLAARAAKASDRQQLFGWLWMLTALVPVWWLPYQERFTYLPSVGFVLVAAAALRKLDWQQRPRTVGVLMLLLLVCIVASAASAVSWAAAAS
jgi:hypothetical protein